MTTKILMLAAGLLLAGSASPPEAPAAPAVWRGVHLWVDTETRAQELIDTMPRLAAAGANVVVIEVNYSFEFQAHPELRRKNFITRATARRLGQSAKQNGIRLIPEFNCLGHQSFGGRAEPLLKTYPQFNETPSQSLTNKSIYCLEWCPQAPGLNEMIFSLIDEITEAFGADAMHVGMDEVYLIGAEECPRCRGKDPAALFAAQVNALHTHVVGRKKWQMLMWADRLIGPKFQGYSRYDNERNDLSAAIKLIPCDIVMCDWHYEGRETYPSVPLLAGKGFHVWPAGFLPLKAARALSDFSRTQGTNVLGYLATTWNETSITNAPDWPPIKELLTRWKK